MSLGLDIFRSRGRAPSPVTGAYVRDLNEADLVLANTFEKGVKPQPLKRISQRHHALARNLAGGMKHGEAAAIVGYDISRVSILLDDPTFLELVNFYRESVDAKYVELHESLAGMALDASEELRRRLEETPEELSVGQLIEVTKLAADRTGHGPQSSSNVNVNVNVASRLEEARKRIEARRNAQVLEVLPNDQPAK